MAVRTFASICTALLTCATNAAFAGPPLDYSELNKTFPSANGNTPEDDAKPGEYYFMRGAEAFRADDFEHAVKMYEVAASWGYKNAQYNLGVMYARGQGVAQDLPRAMAWMALAAERNDKQYVQGRELVYSLLDKEQWDQANAIWRDLRTTYGDAVALERAKARWAEVRNGMTGSHVGTVGHLEVGAPLPHSNAALVGASGATGQTFAKSGGTAADVAGPNTVDGSMAYRNLRDFDNPYDKRLRGQIGIATVEPIKPVDEGEPAKAADAKGSKPSDD